jgi:quinol monooxygenase YgiN/uncharacterized glyoxalase superfamily protein PhnB
MNQSVKHIALVVNDYDEAIEFYTKKLHFTLVEDTQLSEVKRWVVIRPPGTSSFSLLLAKAANDEQMSRVGNQAGGRVFLFMHTDDLDRDYQNLLENKIKIVRERVEETWGKVAVFEDLYGNLWDLIEPAVSPKPPFYSTRTLQVKNPSDLEQTLAALQELAIKTRAENGNISFDVLQVRGSKSTFVVYGCFTDEAAFEAHLETEYVMDFVETGLVEVILDGSYEKVG